LQPVTEDEAYAKKKKRVLVKKHRTKTLFEHQQRPTDGINVNLSNKAFNTDDDTERLERYRESIDEFDVEDQMHETWWGEDDSSISDGEKPMTVNISGKVEQGVISKEEQPLEQDNVPTLDGEEHDAIDCEHERMLRSATFKIEGQWIDIQPDVECGEGNGVGGSIFESEDEDGSERISQNAEFNTYSMVSSMTTGLRHYV